MAVVLTYFSFRTGCHDNKQMSCQCEMMDVGGGGVCCGPVSAQGQEARNLHPYLNYWGGTKLGGGGGAGHFVIYNQVGKRYRCG